MRGGSLEKKEKKGLKAVCGCGCHARGTFAKVLAMIWRPEKIEVLTHGVSSDKIYHVIRSEYLTPHDAPLSLSINGYFNLLAYRDVVFVYDYEKLKREYKFHPVFYVPNFEGEELYEKYGLSYIGLFWEREAYTRDAVPVFEAKAIYVNYPTTIPNEAIAMLKNKLGVPVGKLVHEVNVLGIPKRNSDLLMGKTFYGDVSNMRLVNHIEKLQFKHGQNILPELVMLADEINKDTAKAFGLEEEYRKIRRKYFTGGGHAFW